MTMRRLRRSPMVWLLLGLFLGVGLMQLNRTSPQDDWLARCLAERGVSASATHGQDNFAIATGVVDESTEALYFLDFLTGELKAAALNRMNGKFTAFFLNKNVFKDLGVDITTVKNPRFLMATGAIDLRRGSTPALKFGNGVVYVTELSGAKIAAYAIPWNSTAYASGAAQQGEIRLLDTVQARTIDIRPK